MEPGIYEVRGPNGGVVRLQVPMPGMSLEAFEAKTASGELTVLAAPKPKTAKKPTPKSASAG